jgi:undecaprenyl-diphosphatase
MHDLTMGTAVGLGALQGLTEFLPISSSGHLVVAQQWLGLSLPATTLAAFDVALHAGTLLAVVLFYWRDLVAMVCGRAWRLVGLVLLGTIPAAAIGIPLKSHIEGLFASVLVVAVAWMVTGVMLWSTHYIRAATPRVNSRWRAVMIGVAQAAAMIPGVSRSGSTIAAGLFLGLSRMEAARYSFLLAIPAIGGSLLFELGHLMETRAIAAQAAVGALTAAIVGYAAIHWLIHLLNRGQFRWFGVYCLVAGGITLGIALQ